MCAIPGTCARSVSAGRRNFSTRDDDTPSMTCPGMPPWRGWRSEGKSALAARHLRIRQQWRALSSADSADRFYRHAAVARVATALASVPQRTTAAMATTASGTVGMLQEAHRKAAKQVS